MFLQLTSIGSEFGGNDCVTEQLIRIVAAIIEGITPGTIEHLIRIFPKTPHIQPPPSPHPQNNNPQTPLTVIHKLLPSFDFSRVVRRYDFSICYLPPT